MLPPADGLAIESGRGDREHQRLPARRGRRVEYVPDVGSFMRVELVNDRGVNVETIKRVLVRAERLKFRSRARNIHVVPNLVIRLRDPARHPACEELLEIVRAWSRLVAAQ